MRLALHFDFPGLQEALYKLLPELEIIFISSQEGSQLPADFAADILLTSSHLANKNLPQVLEQCKGLKWVHVFGTGIDNVPLHLIGDRVLTCGRGASAVSIAEWTMAMMLNFEKKLPASWITSPPKDWFSAAELGTLSKKTLAIVGFGAIGQQIAKRALAFDMRVLAKVRTHRKSPMAGVELVENLDELLQQADHLVLSLPATPESEQLIDTRALAQTKQGVHIVNVARASILDQEALLPLLDNGHIACASLDVITPEPLPASHWAYTHPRVRLSPHISWNSPEMMANIMNSFLKNLAAYAQGDSLTGIVDVNAGY
jgi:phosphoglycerate dehydrogenase-like enzyme